MEKSNEIMLIFKEKLTKKQTRDSRVQENVANGTEKHLKTGRGTVGKEARGVIR